MFAWTVQVSKADSGSGTWNDIIFAVSQMDKTLLIVGIVCLLAGIVGGDIEAFGIKIPSVESKRRRMFLAALGSILTVGPFLYSAVRSHFREHAPSPQHQSTVGSSSPAHPPKANATPSTIGDGATKTDTKQAKRDGKALPTSSVSISIPGKVEQTNDGACGINNIGGTVSGNTCLTELPLRFDQNFLTLHSGRPDLFKYEQEIVLTPNKNWQPVSIKVVCQAAISRITPFGNFMNLEIAIQNDDPRIAYISFSSPALAKGIPFRIDVLSQVPISSAVAEDYKGAMPINVTYQQ